MCHLEFRDITLYISSIDHVFDIFAIVLKGLLSLNDFFLCVCVQVIAIGSGISLQNSCQESNFDKQYSSVFLFRVLVFVDKGIMHQFPVAILAHKIR